MSRGHAIRFYDYVNHPYERVRDALTADPLAVFRTATNHASARANQLAVALHVTALGFDVHKDVDVHVLEVMEEPAQVRSPAKTRMQLHWEAAEKPRLFPFLRAELAVYPLTGTETQLELVGTYEVPLGPVGGAIDALVGHRIAEASVHGFVQDVARHLRRVLGG